MGELYCTSYLMLIYCLGGMSVNYAPLFQTARSVQSSQPSAPNYRVS